MSMVRVLAAPVLLNIAVADMASALSLVQLHARNSGGSMLKKTKTTFESQECASKTTAWSDEGNRSIIYLNRHDLDCNGDGVMTSWLMNQDTGISNYMFDYECCSAPIGSCTSASTTWDALPSSGDTGGLFFSERHDVRCDENAALSQWHLSADGQQMRYDYTCCDIPAGLSACEQKVTEWDSAGDLSDGDITYLDRHRPYCGSDRVMTRWHLATKDNTVRIEYTCCSVTTATPAPTPPTPSPTLEQGNVNFCSSTLVKNNLGGLGPGTGTTTEDEVMRFDNVANNLDLIVSNVSEYKPWDVSANGIVGSDMCLGQVGLKCGESVTLRFSLVDSNTGAAVSMENFWFTIADIDQGIGSRCKESVVVDGFEEYYLTSTSTVATQVSLGSTVFVATRRGTTEDNPTARSISTEEKDSAVALRFANIHSFTITYHTDTAVASEDSTDPQVSGYAGRVIQFAGVTSLSAQAKR